MLHKLPVTIGTSTKTVFLHDGFYHMLPPSTNLHCHTHTEFHIMIGGNARFLIGKTVCEYASGEIFSVGPGILHTCIASAPDTMQVVFHMDDPVSGCQRCTLSPTLLQAFQEELRNHNTRPNYTTLACYIALFCSGFYPDSQATVSDTLDLAFTISEFFSHRYQEKVSLSDLATQLHLSNKQTERLVQKYTGRSFTDALISHRMAIAKYLIETTNLSLQEISEYVGYRSYSGFWKAYTKTNL